MVFDKFSDYGSGSSTNSGNSWNNQDQAWTAFQSGLNGKKSSSLVDLAMRNCTLEDALEEFRKIGCDTPYDPDEEKARVPSQYRAASLAGMGPPGAYLRQRSCPEPRPLSCGAPEFVPQMQRANVVPVDTTPQFQYSPQPVITQEQLRVLSTLPNQVLHSILRDLEKGRKARRPIEECRFCKSNGEREAYYRGHSLKSGGRVSCPVLRAFVCRRCGASGDEAHTLKYCPLATGEERQQSAFMLRSMTMASGRRRRPSPLADYVLYGAASPTAVYDNNVFIRHTETPLDPLWAALEQKLMM